MEKKLNLNDYNKILKFNNVPEEIIRIAKKNKKRSKSTVYLNNKLLQYIDRTIEQYNKISIVNISRSDLIEASIENYINDLKENSQIKDKKQYLAIIFTSNNYQNNHYIGRFHGKLAQTSIPPRWSAVKLSKKTIDLINSGVLKYLSLYRSGKGYQYCEEYAEILKAKEIDSSNLGIIDPTENQGDIGRYRIYLKPGSIKKLPQGKIMLGNAQASSLMRGKKTTLGKLLTVKTIDQL